jgi:hypothetical protein
LIRQLGRRHIWLRENHLTGQMGMLLGGGFEQSASPARSSDSASSATTS